MSIFWKNKPTILLNDIFDFIPKQSMNKIEWYNSLTRLLILTIIIVFSIFGFTKLLVLPALIILLIYYDNSIEDFYDGKNNNSCTPPTYNNPFMNRLAGDNASRPEACTDKKSQEIAGNITKDLFKNVDDLYQAEVLSRQFYTNPNTSNPYAREEFAKFCYSTPYSCKDGDNNHCYGHVYEDYRRPNYNS